MTTALTSYTTSRDIIRMASAVDMRPNAEYHRQAR